MIYTCAEIGINHNGDIEIAKKLIDQAIEAGITCVKFQKRNIDKCYTKAELDSPRESPWGITFREQKAGLEFSAQDYKVIDGHCRRNKIKWAASPWDLDSITFLMDYDIDFIKIPSALATSKNFLKLCCKSGRPLVLSTGMLDLRKIIEIVKFIEDNKGDLTTILHCTSTYPTDIAETNLRGIDTLIRNFPNYKIGFSSHSRSIAVNLMAVVRGAEFLEFHVTLDRAMYGSDQAASIEPPGVKRLMRDLKDYELALGSGKIVVYPSEEPIIKKLRKVDDFNKLTGH